MQMNLRARVRAGIAYLDTRYPAWRRNMNWTNLDSADRESCILGQLFGQYLDGRARLFGGTNEPGDGNELAEAQARLLGFQLSEEEHDEKACKFRKVCNFRRLTMLWRQEARQKH